MRKTFLAHAAMVCMLPFAAMAQQKAEPASINVAPFHPYALSHRDLPIFAKFKKLKVTLVFDKLAENHRLIWPNERPGKGHWNLIRFGFQWGSGSKSNGSDSPRPRGWDIQWGGLNTPRF